MTVSMPTWQILPSCRNRTPLDSIEVALDYSVVPVAVEITDDGLVVSTSSLSDFSDLIGTEAIFRFTVTKQDVVNDDQLIVVKFIGYVAPIENEAKPLEIEEVIDTTNTAPELTGEIAEADEIICLDEAGAEKWSYAFSAANDLQGDKIVFDF